MKRIYAIIVLFSLLVVPFINWRAGAVLWLIAWSAFLLQGLFARRFTVEEEQEPENETGEEEKR